MITIVVVSGVAILLMVVKAQQAVIRVVTRLLARVAGWAFIGGFTAGAFLVASVKS